jgi:hypothetical protein
MGGQNIWYCTPFQLYFFASMFCCVFSVPTTAFPVTFYHIFPCTKRATSIAKQSKGKAAPVHAMKVYDGVALDTDEWFASYYGC